MWNWNRYCNVRMLPYHLRDFPIRMLLKSRESLATLEFNLALAYTSACILLLWPMIFEPVSSLSSSIHKWTMNCRICECVNRRSGISLTTERAFAIAVFPSFCDRGWELLCFGKSQNDSLSPMSSRRKYPRYAMIAYCTFRNNNFWTKWSTYLSKCRIQGDSNCCRS